MAPGRTTIAALDGTGRPVAQYDVTVRPSSYGASEAGQAINRLLPGRGIHVVQTMNGLLLRGDAATPAEAEQAAAIARGYLLPNQKLENRLNVQERPHEPLRGYAAPLAGEVSTKRR